MSILSNAELRNRLKIQIPKRCPYNLKSTEKLENIDSFTGLSRNGLEYGQKERRVLLYTTQRNEKIYYQFPGSETVRQGDKAFPYDAKPILINSDGTKVPDMVFKNIWDIIDIIGNEHKADCDIMGAVFLGIAYMINHNKVSCDHIFEDIDMHTQTTTSGTIEISWNRLELHHDVIETLNDMFRINEFSFEAFLYYNDVLAQNEDNKYYYLKGNSSEQVLKNGNGRINNCLSHLTVISHIRGKIGISKLIDSFQRTGVAPLPQSRFEEACGNLVIRS